MPVELTSNSDHTSFKRIIQIAYPMILSMFSVNIMQFIDRTFIAKFDLIQFSAVMPSGMFSLTVSSIFLGIASYVSSLVSQYYGARSYKECAKSMWQGNYLCIVFAVMLLAISPIASMAFKALGHEDNVANFERQYFFLMIGSSCCQLFINSIGGFFNGIGNTKIPMYTQIFANALNILLDWIFIFGKFGLPQMGIAGAGLATLLSSFISLVMIILFLKRKNLKYGTFRHFAFDFELFKKLLRFGFPAGIQFFLGIGSFSMFLLLIGRMDDVPRTSANIVFTIEGVSFLPVLGLSIAVSIVSGQEKGAGRVDNVSRIVKKGLVIAFIYNFIMMAVFNIFPEALISIFNDRSDMKRYEEIIAYTVPLIRLTTLWLVFDSVQITISSVLRTMGDTVFLLIITGIIPLVFMVIPTYLLIENFPTTLKPVWINMIFFVFILASIFAVRFKMGKWKTISVI